MQKEKTLIIPKSNAVSSGMNLNLTPEQIQKLESAAMGQILIDEMKDDYRIGNIDYEKERATFINQCSRNNSRHTKRQYSNALKRLESFAIEINKPILFLKAKEIDDFITSLKNNTALASTTVRTVVDSCSSFFTHISRRYPVIKNPFFGTKMRPRNKNKKTLAIPSKKEIDIIVADISNSDVKAAIIFLSETGLRIGALSKISIHGNRYVCLTKCKEARGQLNKNALACVKKYKLDSENPFKNKKHTVIADTFRRATKRLTSEKKIKAAYSVHDLRHYYAVKLYTKTRDIHLVKDKLNHSSIVITDRYLRALEDSK